VTPFGSAVDAPPDADGAAWLPSRLGPFGTVGGLIPRGFERYVLVEHADRQDPEPWNAPVAMLAALSDAVGGHTTTPDRAWFAIWEGYGWTSATRLRATGPGVTRAERRRLRREDEARAAALAAGLAAVPTFDLANRRYLLLTGPVGAASRIANPSGHGIQPPDLWWPDDRSAFVATDTDLAWSYVGGTTSLIDRVQATFGDRCRTAVWAATNAEPSDGGVTGSR
jgi:hypothetical protein